MFKNRKQLTTTGSVFRVNEMFSGDLCATDSTTPRAVGPALVTVPSSRTRSRIK